MIVLATVGAKFRIAPGATEMFPLIACPGVPVTPILSVSEVTTNVSIVSTLPPDVLAAVPLLPGLNSKFGYVLPENDGVPLAMLYLYQLP